MADVVTAGARGAGVTELIDRMISGAIDRVERQADAHGHAAAVIAPYAPVGAGLSNRHTTARWMRPRSPPCSAPAPPASSW